MSSNLLSETQAEYQGTLSVGMLLTSYSAAPQVKVADTCPCNYAANAESNKRWCCGDYPHLDVSQWALEKITSDTSKWGVFAIQYRTVSCDANIEKEAPNPANLPADPHYSDKPSDLNCASQVCLCLCNHDAVSSGSRGQPCRLLRPACSTL